MITTDERIEAFTEENGICVGEFGITTEPHMCTNTSKVWQGHAFETKLTREGVEGYEWLYTFSGVGVYSETLVDALCFAVEEAEHGGYLESYDRWHQEYDYDYLFEEDHSYEDSQQIQHNWYESSKEYYDKLIKILGMELYNELSDIVMGG